jgi:TetR/AcrR family transcriptional regulator, regulator of autoinduction and epiphytic fitness
VIAEQHRIPELAAEFQSVGKGPAVGLVERYFAAQNGRGRLSVPDPLLAAQQFLGAVKESLFWPALIGVPTANDEAAVIEAATAMILRIYAA